MPWKPLPNVIRWLRLAEKWSKQTGVPVALILATIHQESGGNPNAKRAEPEYLKQYGNTNKFKKIEKETGLAPLEIASSYGLMQLMIPTAWGYLSAHHKSPNVISVLIDPDMAIRYGTAHLKTAMGEHNTLKEIAGGYNGAGSNSQHARNVEALYGRYREWLDNGRPDKELLKE